MAARTLALLVAALALPACPGKDEPCTPTGWSEPIERGLLDRPLLSIWGRGDEIFVVGGGVRALAQPRGVFMRWNGSAWKTTDLAAGQTLWWVWGPSEGPGDVWMVGEDGLALRWDGAALHTVETGTSAILFGVWGSGPDDVWLVGGTPGGGTSRPNDLVLHWDGKSLVPDGPPARGATFFKVWGAGRDDMWVVGDGGLIWHRTAAGWQMQDAGTHDALTTVHGCRTDEVYTVGGQALYRWNGAVWAKVAAVQPSANTVGVFCGPDQVLVVGNGGLKWRYDRAADRWTDETLQAPFFTDFHAAWISPSGALWASGGNYNAPPTVTRMGMLATYGCPAPR